MTISIAYDIFDRTTGKSLATKEFCRGPRDARNYTHNHAIAWARNGGFDNSKHRLAVTGMYADNGEM